jgi:hypothetical protein
MTVLAAALEIGDDSFWPLEWISVVQYEFGFLFSIE